MKICLAGWYFNEQLLRTLEDCKYHLGIVAHREMPSGKAINLDFYKQIPNVGLEFGCYDYYLKNVWKDDDVLFMHDDNLITHKALDIIAGLNRDQVFLFSSDEEAKANGFAHGRAIFCSEKFLRKLYIDGGFWFDEGNTGNIPATTADSPDYHNAGIKVFRSYLLTLPKELTANRIAVIPGLTNSYRGRI